MREKYPSLKYSVFSSIAFFFAASVSKRSQNIDNIDPIFGLYSLCVIWWKLDNIDQIEEWTNAYKFH